MESGVLCRVKWSVKCQTNLNEPARYAFIFFPSTQHLASCLHSFFFKYVAAETLE
jgi:hypothetical protein